MGRERDFQRPMCLLANAFGVEAFGMISDHVSQSELPGCRVRAALVTQSADKAERSRASNSVGREPDGDSAGLPSVDLDSTGCGPACRQAGPHPMLCKANSGNPAPPSRKQPRPFRPGRCRVGVVNPCRCVVSIASQPEPVRAAKRFSPPARRSCPQCLLPATDAPWPPRTAAGCGQFALSIFLRPASD